MKAGPKGSRPLGFRPVGPKPKGPRRRGGPTGPKPGHGRSCVLGGLMSSEVLFQIASGGLVSRWSCVGRSNVAVGLVLGGLVL